MTTKAKEDAAKFVPQERTLPVLRKAVQNAMAVTSIATPPKRSSEN
jgi:hypothetical protein